MSPQWEEGSRVKGAVRDTSRQAIRLSADVSVEEAAQS